MTKKINAMTTKRISVISLMVALTIIFSFVPISFGPISLALMILPVLIIAQTEDLPTTLLLGVFLGGINQVAWFTTKAGSPLAPVFQNPLVCIVPRILIGVVSYFVGVGLRSLVKKINKKDLNAPSVIAIDSALTAVSTACGVLTNTFFVGLFTLLFFNNKILSNGTAISVEYILAWFGLNFAIEIVSFSLLVPPIAMALKKARLVSKPLFFMPPTDNNKAQSETEYDPLQSSETNENDGNENISVTPDNVLSESEEKERE